MAGNRKLKKAIGGLICGALLGICALRSPLSRADGLVPDGFYSNAEGSPVLPLIQAAQSTLDVEIYTMADRKLHDTIRDALHRGVKVRILHEGSAPDGCHLFSGTNANPSADCQDEIKLMKEVKDAGGSFKAFSTSLCPAGKQCLEHGKLVIADHSTALISTGNFDPTNLCDQSENPARCNRDYSLITSDASILGAVQTVYDHDTTATATDLGSVLTEAISAKLTISPQSLAPIVAFFNSAQISIEIENQYLKEPTWNAALIAAAHRGVSVKVMVASACAFGHPSNSDKNSFTKIYQAFDDAGVQSRTFTSAIPINGVGGYLHAKSIIVDGTRAWVGSVNGSTQANTANREYGLFFSDAANVDKLAKVMRGDWAADGAETWQESLNCLKD